MNNFQIASIFFLTAITHIATQIQVLEDAEVLLIFSGLTEYDKFEEAKKGYSKVTTLHSWNGLSQCQ